MDEGNQTEEFLTDLSKALDCINHEFLTVKLNAYEMSKSSLDFLYSYLTERYKRTKINSSYSIMKKLFLLLFWALSLLFYETESLDVTNEADGSTHFAFTLELQEILLILENECNKMIQLFQNNYFKSNMVTCHFIKSSKSAVNSSISRK